MKHSLPSQLCSLDASILTSSRTFPLLQVTATQHCCSSIGGDVFPSSRRWKVISHFHKDLMKFQEVSTNYRRKIFQIRRLKAHKWIPRISAHFIVHKCRFQKHCHVHVLVHQVLILNLWEFMRQASICQLTFDDHQILSCHLLVTTNPILSIIFLNIPTIITLAISKLWTSIKSSYCSVK